MGDPSVRDGVAWLLRKRLTLAIVGVLVAVYAAEQLVRATAGPHTWLYLFFARPDPTPGWVLAPFAHLGPVHLLSSVLVVLVYGAMVEDLLTPRAYLALYLLAGYVAVVGQVAFYHVAGVSGGTIGASGAGLALVGFVAVTAALGKVPAASPMAPAASALAWLGLGVVVAVLVSDFTPLFTLATGTARFGHLGGALAGGLSALWIRGPPPEPTAPET